MTFNRAWLLLAAFFVNPLGPASANVITDWDERAVAFIQPRMVPPAAYRAMAIVHIAMFDAVNSIEPRYRPYYAQLPAKRETSKDAAAAAAAGAVLTKLLPDAASDIQAALQNYLSAIPESEAKSNGIKLGEAVAAKTLEARASDGSSAADAYRPVTTPGVYIPTALTVAPQWPDLTPFAMTSPSQFRPKPPIALESEQWAKDYNEIKELGEKNSSKRSARQTEDARFWLLTGPLSTHPLHRQVAIAKRDVSDRQRALHGGDNGRGSGRHDRGDGCQVQVRVLAPDHCHPQRRHRRQRRDRTRGDLAADRQHADASRNIRALTAS